MAKAESEVSRLQAEIAAAETAIASLDEQRQNRQREALDGKVALAQIEERMAGLHARHQQLQTDCRQRRTECDEASRQREATSLRIQETERDLLVASAAIANAAWQKEEAERTLAQFALQRATLGDERGLGVQATEASRRAWQALREQAHACELRVNDNRHQIDSLSGRLREDYGIELAELASRSAAGSAVAAPALERIESESESAIATPEFDVAAEIEELRRKLSRLGNVNLEALSELTELETRAAALRVQFDDLTAAQNSLRDIISRINSDSRRLFSETFAAVRGHFQELFRKLFGGGMADVVLEDESD
ncbi:MAG: hypothetical protein ACRD36_12930, partial [Candidatus Acidiferrum sp.]